MKPHLPSVFATAAAVAFGAAVITAHAQPQTGATPLQEVKQAYEDLQTYRGTVDITIEQTQGRWTSRQSGQATVAYDDQGRLLVDHPSYYLVADEKLRMKSDQLPGAHLEVDAPDPLTYDLLQQNLGPLLEPPLPDVALLLADDPQAVLGEGASAPAVPQQGAAGRQIAFETATGSYTLTVDPQSGLVTRAVHEMQPEKVGAPAGASARVIFEIRPEPDAELAEDAFAFDATGSQPAGSLQEMVATATGQGGGGPGQNALVDRDAPPIELQTAEGEPFSLDDVEERVVVLDFWATWCPPCREGLPLIENVHDWAQEEGKSVAVYAVNVGETVEQVKQYWEQNDLSMPVLMDTEMQVGAAYGANAIPHTVVIADGKVREVHTGFTPGLDEELKREIEAILQEEPEQEPTAAATPAAAE